MVVGRDSLRCLALATVDEPRKKEDMNLTDPTQFIHFEVCQLSTVEQNKFLHWAWLTEICCWLNEIIDGPHYVLVVI